jgi:hypothetical protein
MDQAMENRDDMKFHSDRAMAELDQALSAASHTAAEAHLKLSALHLERMRALADAPVIGAIHAR